ARPPRRQMRTAFGAELPRHGALEVAAGELLGRPLAVAETVSRHQHEHVGRAAGDILAFTAMALRLESGLALGHVAHRAAIASAFEFHGLLPQPSASPRRNSTRWVAALSIKA